MMYAKRLDRLARVAFATLFAFCFFSAAIPQSIRQEWVRYYGNPTFLSIPMNMP